MSETTNIEGQPKPPRRFETMLEFKNEIGMLDVNDPENRRRIEVLGLGPNIGEIDVFIAGVPYKMSTDEKDFGTTMDIVKESMPKRVEPTKQK